MASTLFGFRKTIRICSYGATGDNCVFEFEVFRFREWTTAFRLYGITVSGFDTDDGLSCTRILRHHGWAIWFFLSGVVAVGSIFVARLVDPKHTFLVFLITFGVVGVLNQMLFVWALGHIASRRRTKPQTLPGSHREE